jgi:hypothetical protein
MDQNVTTSPGRTGDDGYQRVISTDSSKQELTSLTRYALTGLRHCWDDRHGRWSYKHHLDGRKQANEFKPEIDLYYSLNVLLGLSNVRLGQSAHDYDIPYIFNAVCRALPQHRVRNGAWGMALWAAAELGLDAPAIAVDRLRPIAGDPASIAGWTAQDVGLSLSGATAQLAHDRSWEPLALGLRNLLMTRFCGPGALFRDSGAGFRRHIATFATQIYAALALFQFSSVTGDREALTAAKHCAEKLIDLQGPNGEWPWFFLLHNDSVLDPYEIYSVHQHGMAPALLHHAVENGVTRARDAIGHGFKWIFGRNALHQPMLMPSRHLIYRSHARCGVNGKRVTRLLRSGLAVVTGPGWAKAPPSLQVTREMRSYEYGWLLWSFAARSDYPELIHHSAFTTVA